MRRVSIAVRLRNRVQLLSSLGSKELEEVIGNEFAVAVQGLGLEANEETRELDASLRAENRQKPTGKKVKKKFGGFFGLGGRG